MDGMEEFERNLKVAYLNYENNDLKETLKYLERKIEKVLKDDKSLENDSFQRILSCDVFKTIILNKFYNKVELTSDDLNSLLDNMEEMKRNIQEFCNNFRNNNLINFINHIENIADKQLKDVKNILISNIKTMNATNIKANYNDEYLTRIINDNIGDNNLNYAEIIYEVIKKIIETPIGLDTTIAQLINYDPEKSFVEPIMQGEIFNLVQDVCKKININLEESYDMIGGLAYYCEFKKTNNKADKILDN